jgi:hypothetical protein
MTLTATVELSFSNSLDVSPTVRNYIPTLSKYTTQIFMQSTFEYFLF